MNFGADVDQITSLASELRKKATKIDDCISGIYKKLEGLNGNGWQGTGYDTFLADCKAYEPALKQMPQVINDFADFFDVKVKSNAKTLHSTVSSEFPKIEGA